MIRNFINVIIIVGLIIIISSSGSNIIKWGKDLFSASENIENIQGENESYLEKTNDITTDKDKAKTDDLDILSKDIEFEKAMSSKNLLEEIPEEVIPNEDVQKEIIITGVVHKGDTVIELLNNYDNNNRVHAIINSAEKVFSPKKFRIGQSYTITQNVEKNSIKKFEYEINKFEKLVIEGEKPEARIEKIVYDKKLAFVKNVIKNNLFEAVDMAGETPQLALLIAEIFAWEINFIKDIRENDSFSIVVEKLYRNDEFKGYGRAIGAIFKNAGEEYTAFLFYDDRKIENYYSAEGKNLKKVLLQSPLSFSRVTSGYTRSRKHPIFGDYRPHYGIDYGAPKGTPIMAVGNGTVKLRGWVGGYGYQVVIVHPAGFESMYSHMSGFARNLKKGSKVRQGQTIGYVGSTGYSTGPHLDFRLKRYGKYINPASAVSPRAEPVSKKDKEAFDNWVNTVYEFMNGTRPMESYSTEMLKPNL